MTSMIFHVDFSCQTAVLPFKHCDRHTFPARRSVVVEAGYGTGRSRLEILSGHNIIEARGVAMRLCRSSDQVHLMAFSLGLSQFFIWITIDHLHPRNLT